MVAGLAAFGHIFFEVFARAFTSAKKPDIAAYFGIIRPVFQHRHRQACSEVGGVLRQGNGQLEQISSRAHQAIKKARSSAWKFSLAYRHYI
jgi:hypothetical protein